MKQWGHERAQLVANWQTHSFFNRFLFNTRNFSSFSCAKLSIYQRKCQNGATGFLFGFPCLDYCFWVFTFYILVLFFSNLNTPFLFKHFFPAKLVTFSRANQKECSGWWNFHKQTNFIEFFFRLFPLSHFVAWLRIHKTRIKSKYTHTLENQCGINSHSWDSPKKSEESPKYQWDGMWGKTKKKNGMLHSTNSRMEFDMFLYHILMNKKCKQNC